MLLGIEEELKGELASLRAGGLLKPERVLTSRQGAQVGIDASELVVNMCSNNYLGLASHPLVLAAAREALDRWGYGTASVRFICGTQQVHKQLEVRLSEFLGTEDTVLFGSCFDANAGLFEVLLDERDAVISDELNHASIIDGIRLCKAARARYRNRDTEDLERKLRSSVHARRRIIATDGVFSMDGYEAPLGEICDLAERYGAMVMVDDSHGVGVLGENGRGTVQAYGVTGRVDIMTGTLGKALGGASGGYATGRKEVVDLLRQRSRPYLFSNSVPPMVVAASLRALDLVEKDKSLQTRLHENTRWFRKEVADMGWDVLQGSHPIVPIMIGDAGRAARTAEELLSKGVYVVGFSYPVVPMGRARIRAQVSAAHTADDLSRVSAAFSGARRELQRG